MKKKKKLKLKSVLTCFKSFKCSSEFIQNVSRQFFKLFSCDMKIKVQIFSQIFNIDGSFSISTQDLSLFFDNIQESQASLGVGHDINTILFFESLGAEFKKSPIKITSTEDSFVGLSNNLKLFFGESSHINTSGSMAHINKANISWG